MELNADCLDAAVTAMAVIVIEMAVSQLIEKAVKQAVQLLIGAGGCEIAGDLLEHGSLSG